MVTVTVPLYQWLIHILILNQLFDYQVLLIVRTLCRLCAAQRGSLSCWVNAKTKLLIVILLYINP